MKDAGLTEAGLLALYDRVAEAEDAIPRLRRFVLDLAVRGKLVPQDAGDEPALVLLKRIETEKAARAKRGEFRQPKPTTPIPCEQHPFQLPTSWVWSQIAELGAISPRNDVEDDLIASFVPMPMIEAEYGIPHRHEPRRWGEIKKGYTHFAEGDVGLAKITPCFENGKSAVFRGLTGGIGAGTTELHIVRPILVLADYILLVLKSPSFIETGIPKMTGTAGQKRVPTDYFANSPFPLPPLAEQHRIVAKVEALMALLDRLEAARAAREETRTRLTAATLSRLTEAEADTPTAARFALQTLPALTTREDQIKTLRQTILNLAVRGKLVEQERAAASQNVRDGIAIPDTWNWMTLGDFVVSSDAGWSPKTLDHARVGEEWGVLKVSAVSWDFFDANANKQVLPGTQPKLQAQIADGDFLISRANTSELVARAAIVKGARVNLMMSDKIVRLRLKADVCAEFLLLVNNHASFVRSYYAARATGVSPSMKNVSREVILGAPMPVPPLAEQRRIVAKVEELMSLCDRLETSLREAATTRARLLDATLREALTQAQEAA